MLARCVCERRQAPRRAVYTLNSGRRRGAFAINTDAGALFATGQYTLAFLHIICWWKIHEHKHLCMYVCIYKYIFYNLTYVYCISTRVSHLLGTLQIKHRYIYTCSLLFVVYYLFRINYTKHYHINDWNFELEIQYKNTL